MNDIPQIVDDCFSAFTSDERHNKRLVIKAMKNVRDERVRYEQLMGEITRNALTAKSMAKFIDDTLTCLGKGLDVSRVYLYTYDHREGIATNIAEWNAENVEPSLDESREVSAEAFPWMSVQLLAGKNVLVEDVAQAPDENLKRMMEAESTQSLLCLPYELFGAISGFIGFDECRYQRKWKSEDVDVLHSVCHVLSQTMEKERWEEEIIRVERLAAMGRLAGAVAHEINNPLQSALLHLDLARGAVKDGGVIRNLDRIEQSIKRITEIVWRILQLHRDRVEVEDVDINDILRGICVLIHKQFERKGVECRPNFGEGLPSVKGIGQLIHQAIFNVVINALESLDKGGHITMTSHQEKGAVIVEVQDDGAGIDAGELSHIFEPFFTSKGVGRRGLGLFISHAIITDQGGTIQVASTVGEGTMVTITFSVA